MTAWTMTPYHESDDPAEKTHHFEIFWPQIEVRDNHFLYFCFT